MLFSLEALRARHGDSLLLHYGTADKPLALLIDGGPSRVYGDALKPRLQQLRTAFEKRGRLGDDGELVLELLMVSHLDDDHIHGLLDLTDELLSEAETTVPWVRPKTLWHNSFEELTGDDGGVLSLAGDDSLDALPGETGVQQSAAVVASVGQGAKLRNEAEQLRWPINKPFQELVRAPDADGQDVGVGGDVTLKVLAPRDAQVELLRKEWKEQMERIRNKKANAASLAAYLDRSPYNLSSIVCLAKHGDHTMLLTGDARGDHILEALDKANVMKSGALHVDVLKLPHHGSIRNVEGDFFDRVTADHYVVSADGHHGNPETETLDLIVESRDAGDEYAIHLTNADGDDHLGDRVKAFQAARPKVDLRCRADDDLSVRVDLGDAVPY